MSRRCRRARFVVTTPADNLSTAGAVFKSLSLPSPLRTALNLVVSLLLTFLGLLFVTFIIGRVVPIDPVLAIVGDRAPGHVVERVREELGLNRPLYEQFAIYVWDRSEEHTSELRSLMRISYAVFCLKKKNKH